MKPILFNTEMVRAILDGRKTMTRRVIRPQPPATACIYNRYGNFSWSFGLDWDKRVLKPPYRYGGILYVRETWARDANGGWFYKADQKCEVFTWHPSIHMPKEAARIFLRVTDVHIERLQDIIAAECVHEGIPRESLTEVGEAFTIGQFSDLWDSTVKKTDRQVYGWDANPWVWAIKFEQISKEEHPQ
jgi:hypothetical protein